MDSLDFVAIDRKANRGRRLLIDPYFKLLQALLELALLRLQRVQKFAAEWRSTKGQAGYEARRAACRLHLNWIMDDCTDDVLGRFTFAELLQHAERVELQDVDAVREGILRQLDDDLLRELRRPVNPGMMKTVCTTYVGKNFKNDEPAEPDKRFAAARAAKAAAKQLSVEEEQSPALGMEDLINVEYETESD